MPRYQLAIALSLAIACLVSLAIIRIWQPKTSDTVTPNATDKSATVLNAHASKSKDNIAVGELLGEQEKAFWRRTRFRKMIFGFTVTIIGALHQISLCYSSHLHLGLLRASATHILHAAAATYLQCLAVLALTRTAPAAHAREVTHAAALSTLAATMLGATLLLPSKVFEDAGSEDAEPAGLRALWYAVLALYAMASVLAAGTPLRPPSHFIDEAPGPAAMPNTVTDIVRVAARDLLRRPEVHRLL
ncbi:hypothetical protein FA95DRAFT_648426 [Auriscalpium vulgare]|uniref:Uncharacterized protein n=1 Tax=Auriscalpium vulgare TaxID=40419 RepID=A0ACB8RDX1_9AGAM|nr:hypothetical protein FA95DRAFT_648426 [Auriscalpium vulgare]